VTSSPLGKNWKGLACPFPVEAIVFDDGHCTRCPTIVCNEGYCSRCPIYLDWQKLGEIIVICGWCDKVLSREPNPGQPAVSHGICPECRQENFPVKAEDETIKHG